MALVEKARQEDLNGWSSYLCRFEGSRFRNRVILSSLHSTRCSTVQLNHDLGSPLTSFPHQSWKVAFASVASAGAEGELVLFVDPSVDFD